MPSQDASFSPLAHVDDTRSARGADGYAADLGGADDAEIWRTFFSDRETQDTCRAVLDAHARHGPAYTYCFTWEGPEVGACHGIDIPFPFGNFVDGWDAFVGLDDDGRALSQAMRDAWASFARTGDPGWAAYPAARVFGRQVHARAASESLEERQVAHQVVTERIQRAVSGFEVEGLDVHPAARLERELRPPAQVPPQRQLHVDRTNLPRTA